MDTVFIFIYIQYNTVYPPDNPSGRGAGGADGADGADGA